MILSQLDSSELNIPKVEVDDGTVAGVVVTVISVVVFLAIIGVIIAGIRYILSSGDPQQTAKAKSGVLYSIVGLIIAVFAWAIVNFVIREFT